MYYRIAGGITAKRKEMNNMAGERAMITSMSEVTNEETGEIVPALTIAIDGTLKELLDRMIAFNCGFETYEDTLCKVIVNGINTFFEQANAAFERYEAEQAAKNGEK